MNSFRQILYHIVFGTYNREQVLTEEYHEELYRYIWGVINKRKCVLYRINGTKDHIHILSDLHPTIALSDYIKEIKTASNIWMKNSGHFPNFNSWAEGYCAITYNLRDKEKIINYIKNQKEHHRTLSFTDELKQFLKENGIEWDERYLI